MRADTCVLSDEDLHLIFSRFGQILSCEVIRDKRTGDSLQYAFIEFDQQKDCEQAYFKMQDVLIDDHRIHVDFSQSVSLQISPGRFMRGCLVNVPSETGFEVVRQLAQCHKREAPWSAWGLWRH